MSEVRARPKVAVLYHYFHPDDVVSARHLTQFCLDLHDRGWQVEALPCNRGCRDESIKYPRRESWQGLTLNRVWRPRFRQATNLGRILNAAWMVGSWSRLGLHSARNAPDAIVIGTDPVFSVVVALAIRILAPRIRLAHWAFDLHPECTIAEGKVSETGWLVRFTRMVLRRAYQSCDLVADLGSCMRQRLEAYGHSSRKITLVPWALVEPAEVEPPDPVVRQELFGNAKLGLLYSGNFGRAHTYLEILDLAKRLRNDGAGFTFGVRGNCADQVRQAIQADDTNVKMAGFAPEAELTKRLTSADIHLVSLRPEWSGLVVPSKFFGALAAGRPVLFAGPRDAAIARWIEEFKVGWVLDRESLDEVAATLRELANAPDRLAQLQQHCHRIYQREFSRRRVMDQWHRELLALLRTEPSDSGNNVDGSPKTNDRHDAPLKCVVEA